jgi:predicted RNA binding protein YcfA (HicA-like mRNA interferase family)
MQEWLDELEEIMGGSNRVSPVSREPRPPEPPEPHCAWYCPVHFFGHGWGIYIRESCILSHALDIATFVDWRDVHVPHWDIARHLLRSAFYVFFLHEQFHHKVESLGLRLLISTASDRYRPYKANVYRRTFNTTDCIEESLANAESYRRLNEPRYTRRVDPAIRAGLRRYLKWSISQQPPGYREGVNFLSKAPYRDGLYDLQSQMLDGRIPPSTSKAHWSIAPNMITSLADITDDIYVVLPKGARPIFRPTSVDPGATVSSRALEGALTRHYGYRPVAGGKGSHVKLKKPGAPTIILPGNRSTVSPGVVKNVLDALGGHPISRLPDVLDGKLPTHV